MHEKFSLSGVYIALLVLLGVHFIVSVVLGLLIHKQNASKDKLMNLWSILSTLVTATASGLVATVVYKVSKKEISLGKETTYLYVLAGLIYAHLLVSLASFTSFVRTKLGVAVYGISAIVCVGSITLLGILSPEFGIHVKPLPHHHA